MFATTAFFGSSKSTRSIPTQDRVEVFAGKLIDWSPGSKPFNRRNLRLQINDKVHHSPSLSQPEAINRRWPFLVSLTVNDSRPPNVKASHNPQRRSELLLRPRPNPLPVTPNPYKPTTSPHPRCQPNLTRLTPVFDERSHMA